MLCALVAAFYVRTGVAAIALMLLVLLTFQYLLRELLLSRERAERLAALQLGVLVSMIETLALRDRMTARHSAAVARYARAMARGARLAGRASRSSSTPPGCCTTSASSRSRTRSCSPTRGSPTSSGRRSSATPRTARGSCAGSTATGRWPRSCTPTTSAGTATATRAASRARRSRRARRLIAVADTYDVITARDSYRKPLSSEEAIAELRAVAGSQLDPEVVEIFIELLTAGDLSFAHGDDADFEAELSFGQRVHAHAQPSPDRGNRVYSPSAVAIATDERTTGAVFTAKYLQIASFWMSLTPTRSRSDHGLQVLVLRCTHAEQRFRRVRADPDLARSARGAARCSRRRRSALPARRSRRARSAAR